MKNHLKKPLKDPYRSEGTTWRLPDSPPKPHTTDAPEYLDMLREGEATIMSLDSFPTFESLSAFAAYLLKYKCIITIGFLDHCLNFLKHDQKSFLALGLHKVDPDGSISVQSGQLRDGDVLLSIGPHGKVARQGINQISVKVGNQTGYLVDWANFASSLEGLIPFLQECDEVGLSVFRSPSHASMARNAMMCVSKSAFISKSDWSYKVKSIEEVVDLQYIYTCASHVSRLGRFEAFKCGTMSDAYVYDLKAAYPHEIGKLHSIRPQFCRWIVWDSGNPKYELLDRDDIIYASLFVEEDLPDEIVGLGSHRLQTMFGTKILFPYGRGRRWIGLQQYRLRLEFGIQPKILEGCLGFSKYPSYPFKDLSDQMWLGRQRNKSLFKKLDTKLLGSFMGQYYELRDDEVEVLVPMISYCPVYSAGVIDAVYAIMTRFALNVPKGKLCGLTIDGIQTLSSLDRYTGSGPGDLELKYHGSITKFTDNLGDLDGKGKWISRFNGSHLEINRVEGKSLVSCFRRAGEDPKKQQEMFDSGGREVTVKIEVGSGKRSSSEDINYLKDSEDTKTPNIRDLDRFLIPSWSEEDSLDEILRMDESGV